MKSGKERRRSQTGRRQDDAADNRLLGKLLVNLSGAPAKALFTWGSIVIIAQIVSTMVVSIVEQLKGKYTRADINADIKVATENTVNFGLESSPFFHMALAWAIGATIIALIAILIARREQRLRQMECSQMGAQIATLERIIDPKRSTSGLAQAGEDASEDKR